MKNFFRDLLEYSYQYNSIYIKQLLLQSIEPTEKTKKLMSHIINAQHIWNHRISGRKADFEVWTVHNLSQLATLEEQNYKESLRHLDLHDLEAIIEYKDSKGTDFVNTLQEILFHVVNHSNYHRAQIASELVAQGITPPRTDYIIYKR